MWAVGPFRLVREEPPPGVVAVVALGGPVGFFEPIHGSAPDIAGQGKANPLATILSLAMLLRYTLNRLDLAEKVENAVGRVLDRGLRTGDIAPPNSATVTTQEMGDAVVAALSA